MGFWGLLVLCRPRGTLDEVVAIVSRDESIEEIDRPGGQWRLGQCDDATLFEDADEFLADLVAETSAPALLGYVMDSDCVELVARGTTSGLWRSCLERASLQVLVGDEPLDDAILLPEPAVERARQWAREAGMTPDEAALRAVFMHGAELSDDDDDEDEFVFAEELFSELVAALGTPDAADVPEPTTPQATSRLRARPKHPLDAFVQDHVVDLLTAAGFTKRGRTFYRGNERGDWATIGFSPARADNLDFSVRIAIAARPQVELVARRSGRPVPDVPEPGSDMWSRGVMTPTPENRWMAKDLWSMRDAGVPDERGRELQEVLSTQVLPELSALLDRPTLVDVVRDYHLTDGILRERDEFGAALLLADAGPSVLLHRSLGAIESDRNAAELVGYVRAKLAELGYPDDSWREGIEDSPTDPVVRTRGLLAGRVDVVMARHRFSRTDTRYFFQSAAGDYAVVEIRPQSFVGDEVRFRVSSAVVPAREVDRYATARDAVSRNLAVTARNGWLEEWVRPPASHAAFPGADIELTVGVWSFTDDTAAACADAVADAVQNVLPRFTQLLDREQLAAIVMGPNALVGGYDHAAEILGLDLADWHPELVGRRFGPRPG